MNTDITSQQWMDLCANGIDIVGNAINLTDILNENHVAIDKALHKKLSNKDYSTVINYIVKNMNQTSQPKQDAVMFEIAWQLFIMSNYPHKKDVSDEEVQFTTDIRRAYYMKRFN